MVKNHGNQCRWGIALLALIFCSGTLSGAENGATRTIRLRQDDALAFLSS